MKGSIIFRGIPMLYIPVRHDVSCLPPSLRSLPYLPNARIAPCREWMYIFLNDPETGLVSTGIQVPYGCITTTSSVRPFTYVVRSLLLRSVCVGQRYTQHSRVFPLIPCARRAKRYSWIWNAADRTLRSVSVHFRYNAPARARVSSFWSS